VNLDFKRFRVRKIRKPFVLGPPEKPVKVNSSHWPLILKTRQQQRILLVPEAKLTVTFPEYVHKVIIKAAADATGRLSFIAYANGVEVDRSSFRARSAQVYTSEVQASVIDTVVLNARNIALIQISYMPCERCEDHATGNWEQIAGPLCLPIGYPENPGKDPWTAPDCEWLNVVNRLPDDPCVHAQYGGDRAKELVATLKNLVDPHSLQPQADRLIEISQSPRASTS